MIFPITEFLHQWRGAPVNINAGKKSVKLSHTALFSCHCLGSLNVKAKGWTEHFAALFVLHVKSTCLSGEACPSLLHCELMATSW